MALKGCDKGWFHCGSRATASVLQKPWTTWGSTMLTSWALWGRANFSTQLWTMNMLRYVFFSQQMRFSIFLLLFSLFILSKGIELQRTCEPNTKVLWNQFMSLPERGQVPSGRTLTILKTVKRKNTNKWSHSMLLSLLNWLYKCNICMISQQGDFSQSRRVSEKQTLTTHVHSKHRKSMDKK